jgi:flagellar basal body-associated protein FliL
MSITSHDSEREDENEWAKTSLKWAVIIIIIFIFLCILGLLAIKQFYPFGGIG